MKTDNLPRNIIILISDSLRHDSVYGEGGTGLNYMEEKGVQFMEARSAGCWTLPATAGLFTGMLPHEHGATEQTRGIYKTMPTLAEHMKAAGYNTYQVTANIATTGIFGLDRGFDQVIRIWNHVDAKFNKIQQLLVFLGKPRLRKKIVSKDMLMNKMTEDVEMAKTWLQYTFSEVFDKARQIIAENEAKGERSFIFLNLMETHFPYHIAPTFQLDSSGVYAKLKEVISLIHFANQTFLKIGHQNIKADMLKVLKGRQRKAWLSLAPHVDGFVKEIHENTGNLVLFGSDHGENFGESGWTYHFSNVTDAGNKVPFYWLDDRNPHGRYDHNLVSTRDVYGSLLHKIGRAEGHEVDLLANPESSFPIMSSFWYNNAEKTLPMFKYNQMAFLYGDHRFMLRNGHWYHGPLKTDADEPAYEPIPGNANPVEDIVYEPEKKLYLREKVKAYEIFASKIKF